MIMVDHCSLCALSNASTKPLSGKLARWAVALSEYKLDIRYQKGGEHSDVDCLSRLPVDEASDALDESRFAFVLVDYREAYAGDEGAQRLLQAIELNNGYLYVNKKLYVTRDNRENVVINAHGNGHPGIDKTQEMIREKYFWPGMNKDIESLVRACETCRKFKAPRRLPYGEMNSFGPKEPFELVAIDFMGPLAETAKGNKHVLLAIDVFSKYTFATATPTTSARQVVDFMVNQIVAYHEAPTAFIADNGACFKSTHVQRDIQSYKDKLAMAMDVAGGEWDEHLGMATLATNAVKHKTTCFSPYEVLFGRKIRLLNEPVVRKNDAENYYEALGEKLAVIHKEVISSMTRANKSSKEVYDKRPKQAEFKIGDLVFVYFEPRAVRGSTKFVGRFEPNYKITQRKPHDLFVLEYVGNKRNKKTITAHVSKLKRMYTTSTNSESGEEEIVDCDTADAGDVADNSNNDEGKNADAVKPGPTGCAETTRELPVQATSRRRKQQSEHRKCPDGDGLGNLLIALMLGLISIAYSEQKVCDLPAGSSMILTETIQW